MAITSNGSVLRESLIDLQMKKIDVMKLAEIHPNCECEKADTLPSQQGPVRDNEEICWFLTTPNFRMKNIDDLKAENVRRLVKFNTISRIFRIGLSVCRVSSGHAKQSELLYTIENLYEILSNNESGGVIGVLKIKAFHVREAVNNGAPFCIYDTPADPDGTGNFRRPSHADIIWSESFDLAPKNESKVSREALCLAFRNYGEIEIWNDIDNNINSKFLPKKIFDELLKRKPK